MFDDREAERLWRRYKLRTEIILRAVSADVRKQLIEDLSAHVRERVANDMRALSEGERVADALRKLGDPAEFVVPLIADAVVNAPPRAAYGWRAALAAIRTGGVRATRAAGVIAGTAIGGIMAVISVGSLLAPQRIGLFHLQADQYQVRILGLSETIGEPFLAPWIGLAFGAIGAFVLWRAGKAASKLLSEILMDR